MLSPILWDSDVRSTASALSRCAAIATLAVSFSLSPVTDLGQASANGTIAGSVKNESTQKVLERVTVALAGINLVGLAAADGSFRLIGVPAGAQTVQIGYAGLGDKTATVSIAPVATTTVDVTLKSDVRQLTEFRVAGKREGNAYAIQQQKNAEPQRNVVSTDVFGVISTQILGSS